MKEMSALIPNILDYKIGATICNNVGTYYLFLCLLDNKKINISLKEIIKKFDSDLCKANFGYENLRNIKYLGEPKIFLMEEKEYNVIFQIDPKIKSHVKAKVFLPEQFLKDIIERMKKVN